MILLDTDVMIDVLRGHSPAVNWLTADAGLEIGLPELVVMELLQGCQNARDQQNLEERLKGFPLFWASEQDCTRALADFSAFHLSHQLGILDALIGETAIGLGIELATFNDKHYQALGALKTIQPYER
ncbi:MAG: PIN domain-containing protein [Chloroflexota bacterium]